MKVAVYTLGCKVNQYEGQQIISKLQERRIDAVEGLEFADIYIINTCAITSEAEKKSRQCISRVRKINPQAKIIICGCAAQNDFKQFSDRENVTFIKGVQNKEAIVDKILELGVSIEELPIVYNESGFAQSEKTRCTIKIQDGCNNFCSYCIVPYLRGRSRSRLEENIFNEASANSHCQEIVLTGIDISSYGIDTNTNLSKLLTKINSLGKRIRLGSLEVGLITDEFLENVSKLNNFCDHFHLSLQSGCDSILKKMNRRYTTEKYYSAVEKIRKYFPDAGITTDIIAGFPTETESEHNDTINFVKKTAFSDIHIFPYSIRKGTVAASLPQVNDTVKAQRVAELSKSKCFLSNEFLSKQLGKTVSVLVEEIKDGVLKGLTTNYINVYADSANFNVNDIARFKLIKIYNDGVFAEKEIT